MSRHYYFKQDVQNNGFRLLRRSEELTVGKTYKFGIYYQVEITDDLSDEALNKIKWARSTYKSQVKMFRDIKCGDYIWIFDDKIYCFKSTSEKIELLNSAEGPYHYLYNDKTICKARSFEFIKEFEIGTVPLFFSCCNSNQAFNRNTISEFSNDSSERGFYFKVAAALLGQSDKIKVTLDDFCDYLSPKQFEALISFIFLYDGRIPDSLLGGSRKDIDLCVYDNEFRDNEIRYQIKKSRNNFIFKDKELNLIFLGKGDGVKSFGSEWIKQKLEKIRGVNTGTVPSLESWLKCQYPKDIFELSF